MVVIIEPAEEHAPFCMLAQSGIATQPAWARLVTKRLILLLYKFQFSSKGQLLQEVKKLRTRACELIYNWHVIVMYSILISKICERCVNLNLKINLK